MATEMVTKWAMANAAVEAQKREADAEAAEFRRHQDAIDRQKVEELCRWRISEGSAFIPLSPSLRGLTSYAVTYLVGEGFAARCKRDSVLVEVANPETIGWVDRIFGGWSVPKG